MPQSKDVLFCPTGSNAVPGFRLQKLQRGCTIPLHLQYAVCLPTALTVQNLRPRSQGCLQPVFCCLLPSSQRWCAGALGCLVLRMVFIWSGECRKGNVKGNLPASRPWHIINRRTRRGARGRGAKRLWDKLQVMNFLWSSQMYVFHFNEILASCSFDIFQVSSCAV